jgi:hypothetical protein
MAYVSISGLGVLPVRRAFPIKRLPTVTARVFPVAVRAVPSRSIFTKIAAALPAVRKDAPVKRVAVGTGISYPFLPANFVKTGRLSSAGTKADLAQRFSVSPPFRPPVQWSSRFASRRSDVRLPSGARPITSSVVVAKENVITPAALSIVPAAPSEVTYPTSSGAHFTAAQSDAFPIVLKKPEIVITGNKEEGATFAGFSPVLMLAIAGLAIGMFVKRRKK